VGLLASLIRRIGWRRLAEEAVEEAGERLYEKADDLRERVEGSIEEKKRARAEERAVEERARTEERAAEERARAEAKAAQEIENELEALKSRVDRER